MVTLAALTPALLTLEKKNPKSKYNPNLYKTSVSHLTLNQGLWLGCKSGDHVTCPISMFNPLTTGHFWGFWVIFWTPSNRKPLPDHDWYFLGNVRCFNILMAQPRVASWLSSHVVCASCRRTSRISGFWESWVFLEPFCPSMECCRASWSLSKA